MQENLSRKTKLFAAKEGLKHSTTLIAHAQNDALVLNADDLQSSK